MLENWLKLSDIGVNVGINPRTYQLPAESTTSSIDSVAFDAVGKIGLGDIDISEDEKTLYAINLNNNGSLLAIDIASKSLVKEVLIVNPGCGSNGDVRPWGLSVYKGNVYVGLVCSGAIAGGGDLQFFVLKLEGNSFITIVNESLNYPKGFVHLEHDKPNAPSLCSNWESWTTDFNDIYQAGVSADGPRWCRPQAILSDIEFDRDGSMILAFMDRTGHQTGYLQATTISSAILGNGYIGGDILRVYNNNGVYELENGGTTSAGGGCGLNNLPGSTGIDTLLQGPGGGEYYCGEEFLPIHQETSLGGIVLSPHDNLIALNVMDPTDYFTGGTMWLNNTTGRTDRVFELYNSNPLYGNNNGSSIPGTFGKAAGLGDLELACAAAPIELGNYVWNDTNADGIQNPNEIGINGLTVELLKNDVIIATTTTINDGQYYFTGDGTTNQNWVTSGDKVLPNMEYCIRIDLGEAALNQITPTITNSDSSENGDYRDNDAKEVENYAKITLTTGDAGTVGHHYDFGFTSNLCLGDYVWLDKNGDGIQSGNEKGISGIRVELIKNGAIVATCTTNNDGKYIFTIGGGENQNWVNSGDKVLPNMDYTIRINPNQTLLQKHKLTQKDKTDDLKDSDGVLNGDYIEINLTSGAFGTQSHQYDFGFRPTLCVGNLVWLDQNNNGMVDLTETGLPNVEVILFEVGSDLVKGTADDTQTDIDTTDVAGKYLFSDLEEGVYFIKINDGIPGNFASATGSGTTGQNTNTYEPGIATSSDIDNDDNGTQMGNMIMSDTFSIKICTEPTNDGDNDANTNLSVDFGIIPCMSIGNLIWEDANNNGIFDKNEPTLGGVEVQLFKSGADGQKGGDDVLVTTQTTKSDGKYLFDKLKPGDYFVKLNSGIPENLVSSTGEGIQNISGSGPNEPAPDPDNNSNNNDDNGTQMGSMIMSDLFNLTLNNEPTNDGDNDANTNLSIDFGLFRLMSLGNLVWIDPNNNGLFEKGEFGVEDVEAILFQAGPDGQKGTADDIEIQRDTTDKKGNYLFPQLLPGEYYVKLANGIPFGYGSSTGEGIMEVDGIGPYEIAPDPDNDINNDDNGNQMNYMIMSDLVRLTLNQEPINDDDTDNQSNLTVDFGLFKLLRLGNLVWEDFNNNGVVDPGEPGIPGVEAILYQIGPDGIKATPDDVEINRVTTNQTGHYIFIRMLPGEYYVKLNSGINGFSSSTGEGANKITGTGNFETAPDPDNDINDDDNGNQMGAMVMSDLIMMEFMQEPMFDGDNFVNSNLTLDFGLYQPLAIGNLVWEDKNNNGLFDREESGISGIQVLLFDAGKDGLKNTSDDQQKGQTVTDGNGHYLFSNLKPGNYYIKLNNVPSKYISSSGTGMNQLIGNGPYEPGLPSNTDINSDDNGSQMGNMIMSDLVTLTLYSEPINDGDSDRKTNLAVDFGLLPLNEIKIHNPCTCLNNESSPNAGDGQFAEQISILTSISGQSWSVMAQTGALDANSSPVALGAIAKENGTEGGRIRYVFDLRHLDGKGYSIKFSNGIENLSVSNLCNYTQSCAYTIHDPACTDCAPGDPVPDPCKKTFIMGTDGVARVDSLNCCDNQSKFTDDGTTDGLYIDTTARNDLFTICPQNQWQRLKFIFSQFGTASGDTLYVYDGRTITDSLLGKFSGPGISQTNGWVASTCSPSKNASSCLTFRFLTNGDNNKDIGWNGNFECTDREITLTPPNITPVKLACDETHSSFTIAAATITAACGTIQDSQIVRIYNQKDSLCKDTCLAFDKSFSGLFAIGQYKVIYKLKTDTVKTNIASFSVQGAAHVCNDLVKIPLGAACMTLITPDDLLEGPCDTITDTLYYYISIIGMGKNGEEIIARGGGKGGNYPIITKEQFEKYGGKLIANIEKRYYEGLALNICNNGVQSLSCRTEIEIDDNSGPVFWNTNLRDTFKVCEIDLTEKGLNLSKPKAIDNCDSVAVDFVSATIIDDGGACDTTRIDVLWSATDKKGNVATLIQKLVFTRSDTNDLVKPTDKVLSCGIDSEATFDDYSKVRVPGIKIGQVKNGILIPSDTINLSTEKYICGYILQKKDIEIAGDCGKKLFRYWDILDWCDPTNGPSRLDTQFIELKDTTAPEFTDDTLNFNILELDHNSCTFDVTKLENPTATDKCSEVSVRMDKVFRIEDGNLWEIDKAGWPKLDCDSFRIRWVVEDACHEQLINDTITQDVLIKDLTKPSSVCVDVLNISIGTEKLKVHYSSFEGGSYDACGIAKYEVSRDEKIWGDYLEFSCIDVHQNPIVYLRVTDTKGNQNTCWMNVILEDKIAPICSDLPDQKGTCDAQHSDVFGPSTDTNENGKMDDSEWMDMTPQQVDFYNTKYGNPECSDNLQCDELTIRQQYQLIPWPCGMLDIIRRYRAIDWQGEGNISNWAEQNIKIEYKANWSVTFPTDWVGICGGDIPTSSVEIVNGDCDLMAFEVEEQSFTTVEDACLKVVRTFTVINWCKYDANSPAVKIARVEDEHGFVKENITIPSEGFENVGKIQYIQILKIKDTEAPVVTIEEPDACINGIDGDADPYGVEDVTPGTAPFECDELKIWTATATDCSGLEKLTWISRIYEEGKLVKEGTDNTISYIIKNKSVYIAEFWAYDGCGNSGGAETEEKKFWDCKKPTPYCLDGIALALMPTGMITVWGNDINRGSYDNCSNADRLKIKIWHVSLGLPPTTLAEVAALPEQITFTCAYLGNQDVNLYVIDEEGNWDFCTTYVIIQDNNGACDGLEPQAGFARISGIIMDWKGNSIEEVEVTIAGGHPQGIAPTTEGVSSAEMMTKEDGIYHFDLPMNTNYSIHPNKDTRPLNGVSTYDLVLISKHILGIKKLSSPYQYIAADVNQSGNVTAFDMVQIRRLILNLDTKFANNTSWKFVETNYIFTTENPAAEDYPTLATVNNLAHDMQMDFMAVKIGDVNGNARANNVVQSEGRNTSKSFEITTEDRDLKARNTYSVTFSTSQLSNIQGYQFTLGFENMTFKKLINGTTNIENLGLNQLEKGYITTSWNQRNAQPATRNSQLATHLFTIDFIAQKDGKLSEQLSILTLPTVQEAYNLNGELMDVQLTFTKINSTKTFELYQNEPNPLNHSTNIGFYLPESSEVILRLTNETGQLLKEIKIAKNAGNQSIRLENLDLPKGLIYYQLQTRFGIKVRKMLLVR